MGHFSSTGVDESTPDELIGPLNEFEKKYAPQGMFFAGYPELLKEYPRVSIIGTRKPGEKGATITREITSFLVKRKVVIVSGLAAGIDTIAHTTAIKEDGRTIAVIGTPPDMYYPEQNRELQEKIAKDHLLLSQFPPGSRISRRNFPMRNRTMALFSHATVIIEAGRSSGTQHQGWEALRLGRPLFIMDNIADDPHLDWPKKMMDYGAQRLSPFSLDHLIEALPDPSAVMRDDFAL